MITMVTGKAERFLMPMRRCLWLKYSEMRRVRVERGMTLEALATEAGLAYRYMGGIERGQKNPTLDVVAYCWRPRRTSCAAANSA